MKETKYSTLPIESIQIPIWNVKGKDSIKFSWLRLSIKTNGQLMPIQVRQTADKKYELITGRNVFEIMKLEGYKVITCYNHGQINDAEAKRIALETDLVRFEPDLVDIAKLLSELSKHYSIDNLAETMPFTKQEIETYILSLNFNWSQLLITKKSNKKTPARELENTVKLPDLFKRNPFFNPYK
jgi:ParB-like chromosome segregation protein Spo0J